MNSIHLRVRSHYSLLKSALRIDDIIDLCRRFAMPAVGLADKGNICGVFELCRKAAAAGIQPIIGCSLPIRLGPETFDIDLYVKDADGWGQLVQLVSYAQTEGQGWCDSQTLKRHSDGLIALSGDAPGLWLEQGQESKTNDYLTTLSGIFEQRFYVTLSRCHGRAGWESALVKQADKQGWPLIAANECLYTEESMAQAYRVLRAIDDHNDIDKDWTGYDFLSPQAMAELFSDLPDALANTCALAERCSFYPQPVAPRLPHFTRQPGMSEAEDLRHKAQAGLAKHIAAFSDDQRRVYNKRLNYELGIICRVNFAGYFLIVADLVDWAKTQGIPVGPGRGSGAGSLVAWSLGITQLDPIHYGLFFERFLNPERLSMPDFDIDFCQERRDEVIAYVREKYGKDHVASITTFGTLKARAVLRDVGRVLKVPYGKVDDLCKSIPYDPVNPVTLKQVLRDDKGLDRRRLSDPEVGKMMDIATRLEGLYRHASTHAAGAVIGHQKLSTIVPVLLGADGHLATQMSMQYVEDAGLVKFDFLGLKTLTAISRTLTLLEQAGIQVDMENLPLDDQKTYALLSQAQTAGVFQLESPGMREVLRGLKPDRFADIIAVVALYRPGPMDNIPGYIACKHGHRKVTYLDPRFEPILSETYGIIIYQEQVMDIARALAGFSLARADVLRKAMGKKDQAIMTDQRRDFVAGAVQRGVQKGRAEDIFKQVDKFAGYGFNKSHAAAYALIAYRTAWLKANHPVEFLAASMSLELNNTDKLQAFRRAAESLDIVILPPSINSSQALFSVAIDQGKKAIRYALAAIRNVGREAAQNLVATRDHQGPFTSMGNFIQRCDSQGVNKRMIESLAAAGAFDGLDSNRHAVQAAAGMIMRQIATNAGASGQNTLFSDEGMEWAKPSVKAWADTEALKQEFAVLGFYLSAHPLDPWDDVLRACQVYSSSSLDGHNDNTVVMAGSVVTMREFLSRKNSRRMAFVQLSDQSSLFEIGIFDTLLQRMRKNLVVGEVLMAEVQRYQRDDKNRLVARDLIVLDQAENIAVKRLRVELSDSGKIACFKRWVDGLGSGQTVITADIIDNGGSQRFRLKRSYSCSMADVRSLRQQSLKVNPVAWPFVDALR